jgi:hypothetical protein
MTDITTTVTWADLAGQYDDELETLREAYSELEAEYGPDLTNGDAPDEAVAQALQYDQAVQSIEKRQNVLETLSDQFGAGDFEIKMLSGQESMQIETELKMKASNMNAEFGDIQHERNAMVADAATVDAPDGVPREDGSPKPSELPNPAILSLWEVIERFTSTGSVDFRPEGCGFSDRARRISAESATPTAPEMPSSGTEPSEPSAPEAGDDS